MTIGENSISEQNVSLSASHSTSLPSNDPVLQKIKNFALNCHMTPTYVQLLLLRKNGKLTTDDILKTQISPANKNALICMITNELEFIRCMMSTYRDPLEQIDAISRNITINDKILVLLYDEYGVKNNLTSKFIFKTAFQKEFEPYNLHHSYRSLFLEYIKIKNMIEFSAVIDKYHTHFGCETMKQLKNVYFIDIINE